MRIVSLFKTPRFDDPDDNRTAWLLYRLLWFTVVVFGLLGVGTALLQPANFVRALLPAILVTLLCGGSLALMQRRRLGAACGLFVFQFWLVVTVSTVTGGGMETPAVQGYLLVVLAAGLLAGWRLGLLTGLVCVTTQVGLAAAEVNGWLPAYGGVRTPVTYLLVYILISSLVVIFVYYYIANITTSLSQAKQELAERRRAEKALGESEARMRVFANATFEGISISVEEELLEINQQLGNMLGYTAGELAGMRVGQVTAPESLELVRRHIREQYTEPYEAVLIRKDGSRFPVEIRGRPIDHHGRLARLSAIRDLTERKRAEMEMERAAFQLNERIKELTTLHLVAQLLQAEHESIPVLFQMMVSILPLGWQYPEITRARVVFDGVEAATPGFRSTPWMQRAEFRTQNGKAGRLEVAYLEEKPMESEGPFVLEERNLVSTVAEMVQAYLGRRQAEAHSQRQLERITALQAIDAAILSSIDLQSTLLIVIGHITSRLGADAAAIYLLNPGSATLEFAAGSGFHDAGPAETRQRLGDSLAGEAALGRRLVQIANISREPEDAPRQPYFQSEGFITCLGLPLIAKGEVKGVLEVFYRSLAKLEAERLDFLTALAGQAAIAIDNIGLFEELKRRNLDLALAYDVTLEGWSKALDLRDKETEGHTLRVTEMTMRLARAMELPDQELAHIRQGSLLHDVGKLGIPDSILLKPGPLTDEEWVVMRRHPGYAYEWLSPIAYLRPALDIPYCHHEKWDGSGYPRGLAGETIPLAARLFAIVDVHDALTSERTYRRPWPKAQVYEYLEAQSGKHFDPRVVAAFLSLARDEGLDTA